jgi:hypothetical protein
LKVGRFEGWKVKSQMATIQRFEEIEAWQEARKLTQQVYTVTSKGSFARDFALRD